MTNVVIEAKCNFCKETIKFEENDPLFFNLSSNDDIERIFYKCKNCGRENDFELSFELSLKQIKESEV